MDLCWLSNVYNRSERYTKKVCWNLLWWLSIRFLFSINQSIFFHVFGATSLSMYCEFVPLTTLLQSSFSLKLLLAVKLLCLMLLEWHQLSLFSIYHKYNFLFLYIHIFVSLHFKQICYKWNTARWIISWSTIRILVI